MARRYPKKAMPAIPTLSHKASKGSRMLVLERSIRSRTWNHRKIPPPSLPAKVSHPELGIRPADAKLMTLRGLMTNQRAKADPKIVGHISSDRRFCGDLAGG